MRLDMENPDKELASGAGTGFDPGAPWPCMRHDYRNTGRADDIKPSLKLHKEQTPFWSFRTGGPIFFTPSVGADGTIYFGSADFYFYAIRPDGTLKWKFKTDRYIVGGAALSADGRVYFPGADGYLHALDVDTGQEVWRFASRNVREDRVEMVGWFEGNITIAPDGLILAPNDDFCLYGVNPDGSERFAAHSRGMVWSAVPTDGEGRHFFCSLDMSCYCVDAAGKRLWKSGTRGVIAGSPALGRDGTVYITSHDGKIYALNPVTGKKRWAFKTGDFICGSTAVGADGTLYAGGGDGTLYALKDLGDRAELHWAYSTLEPIRSSPVIDGDGNIYFANGEGKVFALGPEGRRRWSIDLSESDLNDINGSIALGRGALYFGMQDGRLVQVPYDYGLREEAAGDPRVSLDPGEDLPAEGATIYRVTPGGRSVPAEEGMDGVLPGNTVTLRLLVRKDGKTVVSGFGKRGMKVKVQPFFEHRVTRSMDRRYLNITPEATMVPGTEYRVRLRGRYRKPRLRLFNHIWLLSGRRLGRFSGETAFRTVERQTERHPEHGPLLIEHMSFYQPTIFPGLMQIGMDDVKIIVVPVEQTAPNEWISWGMLGWPDENGGYRVMPGNRVALPARVAHGGDLVMIEGHNFAFDQGGDRFGVRLFRMCGRVFGEDSEVDIGVNCLYCEGKSLSMAGSFYDIPVFGTPLAGTGEIHSIDLPRETPAGFQVKTVYRKGRKLITEYDNEAGLSADDHHIGMLLIDKKANEAVRLDYPKRTSNIRGPDGRLLRTELRLPALEALKTRADTEVVVIMDGMVVDKEYI